MMMRIVAMTMVVMSLNMVAINMLNMFMVMMVVNITMNIMIMISIMDVIMIMISNVGHAHTHGMMADAASPVLLAHALWPGKEGDPRCDLRPPALRRRVPKKCQHTL